MSYGRRVIYTDTAVITAQNVVAEVNKALQVHLQNRTEIQVLYDYYRGITPILDKTKEIREEINHKVNENIAYEIVQFHKGFGFGEEIQCIRREASQHTEKAGEHSEDDTQHDNDVATDISALNAYLADADKHACDNEIAEWLLICGVGYRFVCARPAYVKGMDTPILMYSLDPRNTFVVYSSGVGHPPVMGVTYVMQANGTTVYTVYTPSDIFQFSTGANSNPTGSGDGVKDFINPLYPYIPIIEYPADSARLGCFEVAIPLLDAINELQSNRMDDIVQTVNAFLAILGGEINDEVYKRIMEFKMLALPEGVDAKYLSAPLDESDIQTLKNDLRQAVLTICAMPNRNGGSSTSDTGVAVIYRDGWEAAEAKAKSIELLFKKSEKVMLRIVLKILANTVGTSLTMADIETHFNRRNFANMTAKANILVQLLQCGKVHPELAFIYSDIDPDPAGAYLLSKAYYEEERKRAEEREDAIAARASEMSQMRETTNGSNGQSGSEVS